MRARRFTGGRRRLVATAVAAVLAASAVPPAVAAPPSGGETAPAAAIDWRPCPLDAAYDCARVPVPLDHTRPGGRTIELALVRRPAAGSGQRLGTLFFNPGGPGGPGTVQLPLWYDRFPAEVRKRFDIISWDPRGVGSSTAVNCFGDAEGIAAWAAGVPVGFPVGAAEQRAWVAGYAEMGRRCQQRDAGLLPRMSTADTARDLDRLRAMVGDEQVNYLGISYGTFLGATYANLFPHRVRRMILDGNVDPRAYTNDGNRRDAEHSTFIRIGSDLGAAATLRQFLTLCGSATPAGCAFSAGSPRATRDRFDLLMRRLRQAPVGSWTYPRVIEAMSTNLLYETGQWPAMAGLLQSLWQGRAPAQQAAPAPELPTPLPYLGPEQPFAVLCAESPNPSDTSAYPREEAFSVARSGDVGHYWGWSGEPCATWPARAAHPYTGPWNTPTAHPVLVVNNTYDPATPYRSGVAMARELADARLLTLNGYGHTALNNPSSCVHRYETAYLIDGTLPPAGATCEQDAPPFAGAKPRGGVDAGGGGTAPRRTPA
ncbi:alpha/beta hydrolase [Streptomyces sp. NPDC005805]|uniref:alpha/beta hydrolase n=1 Tax=Streptomyces sp. NPDC005805 TaxID=3157068 RepID=UPI0033EFB5D2